MKLEKAIKHCEEKAKELKEEAHSYSDDERYSGAEADCIECAKEYEQLAEWLTELKDYREGKRTCEFCKYNLRSEKDYPCSICRCNHPNKFEWDKDKRGNDK